MFYRGLRICTFSNNYIAREILCGECAIAPLVKRRNAHLLMFMHKQSDKQFLLKEKRMHTRLHNGPVFKTYKLNNEKAKANVFYRGALMWNNLNADCRNLDYIHFKSLQKQQLVNAYLGN